MVLVTPSPHSSHSCFKHTNWPLSFSILAYSIDSRSPKTTLVTTVLFNTSISINSSILDSQVSSDALIFQKRCVAYAANDLSVKKKKEPV